MWYSNKTSIGLELCVILIGLTHAEDTLSLQEEAEVSNARWTPVLCLTALKRSELWIIFCIRYCHYTTTRVIIYAFAM